MPATYMRNPETGTVHLVMDYGDGDMTMCGRDTAMADSGGFEGEPHNGPSNCEECRQAYDTMREGMRGARWSRTLRADGG